MAKRNVLFVNPDSGKFGPAMLALLPRQQAFVDALLTQGDSNYTRAALTAGYADSENSSIRATAHRLAHDAKILDAIQEESQRRIRAGVGIAVHVLERMLEGGEAEGITPALQVKIAEMIMNRSGLHVTTKHETTRTVVHELSADQRTRRLAELLRKRPDLIGLTDGKRLALPDPNTTDADFVEVVEPSTEGLEDLL